MENNRNNSIGFVGLLQIAFIVLKLCRVIDWSWWMVLRPILFCCFVAVVAVLVGICIGLVKAARKKKLNK